jgi:8-oxo-dGTP pyrophosphatase MutT (NUDIX family)
MPQKYIVYFNQKSIVFNNPTAQHVRNFSSLTLLGNTEKVLHQAIEILENDLDTHASVYLPELPWNDALPLLKTSFKYLRAAGGLIQNTEKAYLLIYRLGQWDLPKGKIEKGESDAFAAEREILEETGIPISKPLTYLTTTWHTYKHKNTAILKETIWYTGECEQAAVPVAQQEESIEFATWCKLQEAETRLLDTYPSIADVWIAYTQRQGINP